MSIASTIANEAHDAGWTHANETLVSAVLAGTAMIATTGAGVSPELAAFILDAETAEMESQHDAEMDRRQREHDEAMDELYG
jgi:hypothetical protein